MKKVLALVLTLVMVLSLTACGGGGSGDEKTKATEAEEKTLKVGDTAEGKMCDVTIKSVEYVDKIKDGYLSKIRDKEEYKDVTAESGYSIVEIKYSFDYKGKKTGDLDFGFVIDYNGYTFDDYKDHSLPKPSSGIMIDEDFCHNNITSFNVDDALSFKGDEGVKYICVNDEVKKDTDKPYVLKVNVSLSDGNDTDKEQKENFVFDLR